MFHKLVQLARVYVCLQHISNRYDKMHLAKSCVRFAVLLHHVREDSGAALGEGEPEEEPGVDDLDSGARDEVQVRDAQLPAPDLLDVRVARLLGVELKHEFRFLVYNGH